MAKGLLYVESWPSAPEREAEYHAWYEEIHLPEVVALEGFVSARRLAPLDGAGPFVALYEMEADDLRAAVDGLQEAVLRGDLRMSDALRTDPMPVMRLMEVTAVHEPTGR
ncbi:hypothetical protein ACIREO_06630 [Streptomyces sp. NPDC102441]|uniref:hypothetical protein n=1 Tax=Streptomyces sp. NPDC102441 TaxID=3366176 RepID=UPI0037FE9867